MSTTQPQQAASGAQLRDVLMGIAALADTSIGMPASKMDEVLAQIQQVAARATLSAGKQSDGTQWMPIDTAPTEGREMFVVRAFDVCNGFTGGKPYTSDAWCVWREPSSEFARWPHHFPPTHWAPLPHHPAQRSNRRAADE